ncbi:MAG: hypothetical protein H6827_08725 [Planctomycetes bacterium]|mgnify:CR=1 FL=1|nr:hypothetical protein [Planctomycetota bacterium]HPF14378.1 sialate O-acetylesterase [Planctomycetota bacterium]
MKTLLSLAVLLGLLAGPASLAPSIKDPAPRKVQVFLLAGQSNMEGHGQIRSLGTELDYPGYDKLLDLLRDKGNAKQSAKKRAKSKKQPAETKWATRDDVTIVWNVKQPTHGPLGVGWGANETEIGPELMFGTVMGEHFDAPVLLIKTAWGGKDVFCDFRSPSAGPPTGAAAEILAAERARDPNQEPREVGHYYRAMLEDIRGTLGSLDDVVPGYKGQGYELAGLAWFQGWNDYCRNGEAPGIIDQYPAHLAALFRDLRKDLNAPNLPIAIGEMGVGGLEFEARVKNPDDHEAAAMLAFRRAQKAVAEDPTLAHVTFVPTAAFWDDRLEALRRQADAYEQEKKAKGIPNTEENHLPDPADNAEFLSRGGHWYCHYNGSAATYCLVGAALAQALLDSK